MRRGGDKPNLYGHQWRKFRRRFLAEHPLCVMCEQQGRTVAATVVDHITPHRGDQALFWQEGNHQPLCKQHHDSTKQRMEKQGRAIGCDEHGIPVDQGHHWARSGE